MATQVKEKNSIIHYLSLAYVIIFYSQIGERIPALGVIRIELIIGLLIILLIFFKIFKGEVRFKKNQTNTAALLFLGACLITVPFAYYMGNSVEIFIRLIKFFCIYLMIIFGISTEKDLKRFIWIYVLMISFVFTESFFYAIQGLHIRWNSGAMRLFGPPGLFGHPNSLGGVTVASLPFFFFLARAEKSWIVKILLLTLTLTAIRVIMYTNSRTAFIGLIGFGIIFWLFSKRKLPILVLTLVSGFLLWQIAPPETLERFLSLGRAGEYIANHSVGQDAMGNRLNLLVNSFTVFLENPITGVGVGNFIIINGSRFNMWLPTHNLYTQVLCETGLIGFICFAVLIVLIFRNLHQASRLIYEVGLEGSLIHNILLAVKVFLILRLLVGLFGDDLYDNYWWIAGGLSVVVLDLLKQHICSHLKKETIIEVKRPRF